MLRALSSLFFSDYVVASHRPSVFITIIFFFVSHTGVYHSFSSTRAAWTFLLASEEHRVFSPILFVLEELHVARITTTLEISLIIFIYNILPPQSVSTLPHYIPVPISCRSPPFWYTPIFHLLPVLIPSKPLAICAAWCAHFFRSYL